MSGAEDQGKPVGPGAGGPEPEPDDRRGTDWIGIVASASKWVGLKPVRVRWKLENWRRQRVQARRRREQRLDHIRYQHKTCDACGAVQDRDAAVCSRCGERLGRRSFQVLRRLGVFAPQWLSMSSLLGITLTLAFARVLFASPGGFRDLFGLPVALLAEYGGHYPPAVEAGEYWRWLTACFLHAGVLHIGFNLFALSVVGPQVESLYGRMQMLFLFVATGVLANIGSGMAGMQGVGIGASGGIMGLVGVAAGWGHREGTTAGRTLRNDMLKWSAYVFIFGFFINADNWAHLFGLLSGLGFGVAVRPNAWRRRPMAPLRAATAVVAAAAAITALVLIARPPTHGGDRDEMRGVQEIVERMDPYVQICRLHWQGDTSGAIARAQSHYGAADGSRVDAAQVTGQCDRFRESLVQCRAGDVSALGIAEQGDESRRAVQTFCSAIEQAFGPVVDRLPGEKPDPGR